MAAAGQVRDLGEAQRSEVPGDGEHAKQKTRVADAVYDECFVGRGAGTLAMEIESDEQIRAEAHALPAYEHQRIIVRQNEREHGEHEQVQVSKETVIPAFMRHVASRVNVDQRSDASHKQ